MTHLETAPLTCGDLDCDGVPCLEVPLANSLMFPLIYIILDTISVIVCRCDQITQKTPLRVLHRRSALTRTRHIYSMSAARLNDHYFVLNVITSAGAYVKEFVHGDLGRTSPSISTLLGSPVSHN